MVVTLCRNSFTRCLETQSIMNISTLIGGKLCTTIIKCILFIFFKKKNCIIVDINFLLENIQVGGLEELVERRLHNQQSLRDLHQQVRTIMLQMDRDKVREKAIRSYVQATPQPNPAPAPLEGMRRKTSPISPEVQALIAQKMMYEGGSMTWEEAMDTYKVSRASISRIVNKEKRKQNGIMPAPPKKRGRKTPLTLEILTFVLSLLEVESQLTLKELVIKIELHYPIQTSVSALDKALKKLDVTWKNVLPMLTSWNTPDVIHKRQQFVQLVANLKHQNTTIYYADETGFNLHTKKSKGRAVAGQPAKLTLVPKGKRVTVIAAIGPNGFVHTRIVITGVSTLAAADERQTKGTTAEHFRAFLLDFAPKARRNSALILDNCKIHHAERLQPTYEMVRVTYGLIVHFLSPYSPFLNPIELGFNKLKTQVQQDAFTNQQELVQSINNHIPDIDADDATGFYAHSAKFYQQSLLGLPFQGKPLDPDIINPPEQVAAAPTTPQPVPVISSA